MVLKCISREKGDAKDFEEYKRESGQPFEEEQKKLLELLEQAENMLVSVYGENSKED